MDDSVGLSSGIALRDLYKHPNLRLITLDGDGFVAENIRGQQFRLSPVDVDGALAFHATLIYLLSLTVRSSCLRIPANSIVHKRSKDVRYGAEPVYVRNVFRKLRLFVQQVNLLLIIVGEE